MGDGERERERKGRVERDRERQGERDSIPSDVNVGDEAKMEEQQAAGLIRQTPTPRYGGLKMFVFNIES